MTQTEMTLQVAEPMSHHPALLWFKEELLPALGGNMTAACREVGISPKTIKGLISGEYGGNAARQLAKLEEARASLAARVNLAVDHDLEHVQTALMNRVWANCDAAKVCHMLNYVGGKSQIGKTTALEAYAAKYPETTHLMRMPSRPTVSSMLRELLLVCGLPAATSVDAAMRTLRAHLSKRHLVLVDEAHLALTRKEGLDCLECLRELWDRCKCGMVLAVTDVGAQSIVRGPHAVRLMQFERRGAWDLLPPCPSQGDVAAIWRAYGLPEPQESVKRQIAAMVRATCFGQFCKWLKVAKVEASSKGRALCWDDFIDVAERLGRRPE